MAPVALNSIYTKAWQTLCNECGFLHTHTFLQRPADFAAANRLVCKTYRLPRTIGLLISVLASDDLVGKVNAVCKSSCLRRFRSWFRSTFHWASSSGMCRRHSRSLGELEVLSSFCGGWFTELEKYRHLFLRQWWNGPCVYLVLLFFSTFDSLLQDMSCCFIC